MEIGNHSFSHPKFTSLTSKQMLDQLNRAEQTIYKATGKTAKPLFRYPYGAHNKDVAAIVTNAGYQSIYWSVDSLDSVGKKKTPDFLAERVISKLQDGGISLMHVSSVPSAEALPRIFAHLEKEGFKVVPVSELLREAQQAVKRETGEAP